MQNKLNDDCSLLTRSAKSCNWILTARTLDTEDIKPLPAPGGVY